MNPKLKSLGDTVALVAKYIGDGVTAAKEPSVLEGLATWSDRKFQLVANRARGLTANGKERKREYRPRQKPNRKRAPNLGQSKDHPAYMRKWRTDNQPKANP